MKNNNYMKVITTLKQIVVIMMILSISGCSTLNSDSAEMLSKALNEKYGENFKVEALGKRFGTATNDTVSAYITPENNPDLKFEAIMNEDGSLVSDNYIARVVFRQVEKVIRESFQKESMNVEVLAYAFGSEKISSINSDMTLEQFVQEYTPELFISQIIVQGNANLNPASLIDALNSISAALYGIGVEARLYIIEESNYEKCASDFKEEVYISKTWFNDYNVVNQFTLTVSEEGINKSEDEIIVLLEAGE